MRGGERDSRCILMGGSHDRWTDKTTDGCGCSSLDERICRQTDEKTDGWKDGWMERRTDNKTGGRRDVRMESRTDGKMDDLRRDEQIHRTTNDTDTDTD